ncbi:MAG: C10 family peptidase [Myxococcota bacterium]
MKKSHVLIMSIIVASIASAYPAHAAPVSGEDALAAARQWMAVSAPSAQPSPRVVEGIFAEKQDGVNVLYVVNFEGGGFVLLSADDVAGPVLGYSPGSTFTHPIESPAVRSWIGHYGAGIREAVRTLPAWQPAADGWSQLVRAAPVVPPLLKTTWHQNQYYNHLCPLDAAGPDGRALAGCGAAAMAQVMRYHRSPCTGTGSHSYSWDPYGTISADFGATSYKWQNMPLAISDYNDDIAVLLFHCGVSVDMEYSPTFSNSYMTNVSKALATYFSYKDTAKTVKMSDYTTADWTAMLKADLGSGLPVIYRGADSEDKGGHIFVCDGYDSSDFFHFNWGWSGKYDGYFSLTALTPGEGDYSYYHWAVVGIAPIQACCKCSTGACCDGCQFRASTFVCDSSAATGFKCDGDCAGAAMTRTQVRHCSGSADACDGATGWLDWQLVTQCGASQICRSDAKTASCEDCVYGCSAGACMAAPDGGTGDAATGDAATTDGGSSGGGGGGCDCASVSLN